MYDGFKDELSKIQSKINKSEDNNTNMSSPTDSESSKNTNTTGITLEASPDYSKNIIYPATLRYLDDEIKRNQDNLNNIDKICKDVTFYLTIILENSSPIFKTLLILLNSILIVVLLIKFKGGWVVINRMLSPIPVNIPTSSEKWAKFLLTESKLHLSAKL